MVGRANPVLPNDSLGIRSFWRWAEYLEDEVRGLLALEQHFDGRPIRDPASWNRDVLDSIQAFLLSHTRPSGVNLRLDCHGAIAFSAGAELAKYSGEVSVLQGRGATVKRWVAAPNGTAIPRDAWVRTSDELGAGRQQAVAVSVTHDIRGSVLPFVRQALPDVGRLDYFELQAGVGPTVIGDGHDADLLAQGLVAAVRSIQVASCQPLHIFIAAPNGLQFFFGKRSAVLGTRQLYEFTFGQDGPGTYSPAMAVIPSK
jgi:hypothetical protein